MASSTSSLLPTTDATFTADVEQAAGLVIVDFWAPWCGPCRMVTPLLEQLASEYAGRLTVRTLNADEQPATPRRFNVRSLPTLLFVRQGQVVRSMTGAAPKAQIARMIDEVLAT